MNLKSNKLTAATWLVFIGLVFVTIMQTWDRGPEKSSAEDIKVILADVGVNLFAKLAIGMTSFLQDTAGQLKGAGATEEDISALSSNSNLEKLFEAFSLQEFIDQDDIADGSNSKLVQFRIIIAGHLGLKEEVLNDIKRITDIEVAAVLTEIYVNKRAPSNTEAIEKISNQLKRQPFVNSLFHLDLDRLSNPECCQAQEKDLRTKAKNTALRCGLFAMLAFVLGVSGVIFLVVLIIFLVRRKLQFRVAQDLHSVQFAQPLFEAFTIYLLYMNLVFIWGSSFASDPLHKVYLNIMAIGLAIFVILWPMFRGLRWSEIKSATGLYLGGIPNLFANMCLGPLLYFSGWLPFYLFSVLYQLILYAIGTDVAAGTHPLVPVLLSPQGSKLILPFMLLGAVVVPIVEEIMFRGFLYGYLRSRMKPISAIFLSGFIFAVIHPQGAIGILPLTLIGAGLAFIREWRGSLVPCIITHACVNGVVFLLLWSLA